MKSVPAIGAVVVMSVSSAWAQPGETPKPTAVPPAPASAPAPAASPAESDALAAVVPSGAKPVRICTGHQFTEGPLWIADAASPGGGYLLFSDIPVNTIFKWTPGEGGALDKSTATPWLTPTGNSNGLTLDTEGRVLIAQHAGKVSRREGQAEPVVLAEKYQDKQLNSPNDLCARSDGLIYFTDPPYGLGRLGPGGREREQPICGVYLLKPDGSVTVLVKDLPTPNGIAFSPDEKAIYIADTSRGIVNTYPVNPDGTLGEGKLFAEVKHTEGAKAGKSAGPDGVRVDTRGNVYVAAAGGAWVFDSAGKKLGVIRIEGSATNVCFGGADRTTLFMTSSANVWAMRTLIPGLPTPMKPAASKPGHAPSTDKGH